MVALPIDDSWLRDTGPTYVREGDTLKVALPQKGASLNFTINEDGSLGGPLGIRLEKADR